MKKFFIHTTGCKANQCDSYEVSGAMRTAGFTEDTLQEADVVVVNACTLTNGAERDIRRFINFARKENGEARIVLTGCHPQVYPESTFGADLVLGQDEKFQIGGFLEKEGSFVSTAATFPLETFTIDMLPGDKTRFFLKIQDGCDRFCSYCVVPRARGNPRSRPAGEIVETMKALKDKGVREVVLTGIEISAYRDAAKGMDLKGLLKMLAGAETPERIRMSSIDPLYIDDEFIEIVAQSKKIMRSLHIPMLSASDGVLNGMGRSYTREFMGDLLEGLHGRIPRVGIGLDVIVGFPGEDEDRFLETMSFIETADIFYLHVFPFSARSGTKAAEMKDKVAETTKKERSRRLRELDKRKRDSFYGRFIGEETWIIPEGKVYNGKFMRGYTDNYLPVHVPYEKRLENCLLRVTIEGIEDGILMGRA